MLTTFVTDRPADILHSLITCAIVRVYCPMIVNATCYWEGASGPVTDGVMIGSQHPALLHPHG